MDIRGVRLPLTKTLRLLTRAIAGFCLVASCAIASRVIAAEPYTIRYADPLSEPWRIRRFSELEGRGVRCMAEDDSGSIWFGLRQGVVRYDGYAWTDFGPEHGLPDTAVLSIAKRATGQLVAATAEGLFEQDGVRWSPLIPTKHRAHVNTSYVVESSDTAIWAASTWGLIKYSKNSTTLFTSSALSDLAVKCGFFDRVVSLADECVPSNRNYQGTDICLQQRTVISVGQDSPARAATLRVGDEVLSVNDLSTDFAKELRQPPGKRMELEIVRAQTGERETIRLTTGDSRGSYLSPNVNAVMEDSAGRIWVGFVHGRVAMSPDSGRTWQTWKRSEGLVTELHPSPVEAANGDIWIFSAGRKANVSRYDGRQWSNQRLMVLGGRTFIGAAAATADGTLWVGGLNRLHVRRDGEWKTFDSRVVKFPSEGHRMLVASDGTLWIAGFDQAAVRISLSPTEYVSLEGLQHCCTEASGTRWYVDDASKRLVRQDEDGAVSFGHEDGAIDSASGMLAVPGVGVVAIGSHENVAAVSTYDGSRWTRITFPDLSLALSSQGSTATREGKVWIAATGNRSQDQVGGIVYGSGASWKHFRPPEAPPYATSAMELPDGRMWFGGGFGVYQFDGTTWSRVKHDLVDNTSCPTGTVDSSRTVYLGTRTKGVLRYKNEQWTALTTSDGLPTNEISTIHVDADDRLWVATRDGLCRFDGSRFSSMPLPDRFGRSSVQSEPDGSLWLDGKLQLHFGRDPAKIILDRADLRADSQQEVMLTWRGVDKWNRTPSDKLAWSWRIDNGAWSEFTTQKRAIFEDLSSGEHSFEVLCRDGDFNVSPVASSVAIHVRPPIWRRSWFIALASALSGIILWQGSNLVRRGSALRRSNKQLAIARQQLAEQFAEKSAQFRAICDCSPVGIFVTDQDSRVTYFNDYLAKVSGFRTASEVESKWLEAVHPEDRGKILQAWADAIENQSLFRAEGRFQHPDGTLKRFEVVAARIERDGVYLGYVGALDDVTERYEASERLKDTNLRLRSALEQLECAQEKAIGQARLNALGQMAAGVAHDISNSLTPLMTYAELLESDPGLSEKGREWARLVQLGVADTAETVRRLDHFYRESHNREFLDTVDLAELVQETIQLTRPKWQNQARAARKQIRVATELGSRPMVRGDAAQIRSVLTNIIFNAVDAITDEGTIEIRTNLRNKMATVEVIDNGEGMTPEQLKHCTEPFFTSKIQGSGLGLSECYGIVRQHGGTLQLESAPGQGTKVRFELPCEITPTGNRVDEQAARRTTKPHIAPAVGAGRRKRMLYIDDDPQVRQSTAALCSLLPIQVETAEDGPAGLRKLEQQSFQLVICDQGLPGMDGVAVLKEIKRRWPELPVVLVSGWSLPRIEDGPKPDDFLEKPFSLEALRAVTRRHLESTNQPADQ